MGFPFIVLRIWFSDHEKNQTKKLRALQREARDEIRNVVREKQGGSGEMNVAQLTAKNTKNNFPKFFEIRTRIVLKFERKFHRHWSSRWRRIRIIGWILIQWKFRTEISATAACVRLGVRNRSEDDPGRFSSWLQGRSSDYHSVDRFYENHVGTGQIDTYKRVILVSVIRISGLHCRGVV